MQTGARLVRRDRLDREAEEELLLPAAARSTISRGRVRPEEPDRYRTVFERDRDRIVHSKAFRRLTPDHTILIVVDFADAAYELLDGEAEVWPGPRIVPTPGHTDGHQSLVVDTAEGRVVLAGQSFDTSSEFAVAQVAWQLKRADHPHLGSYAAWLERLEAFDPWRVLFAHDVAIWQRGAPDAAASALSGASR